MGDTTGGRLTAKQEGFTLLLFEGETAADAYRAFYSTKNKKESTIHEAASRLAANCKVVTRLASLRSKAAERSIVTVQSITEELDENRSLAKKLEQIAAMNVATIAKAKVNGVAVDKVEVDLRGKIDSHWTVEVIAPGEAK